MLAFKIYHHLHPPDCDSPCTLHHQSHSMEGEGGKQGSYVHLWGGGESREVTCACRGGRGVTCTCDFTPVSAKDTRSIVQREPSSETMPASPSVMSSVFLSA